MWLSMHTSRPSAVRVRDGGHDAEGAPAGGGGGAEEGRGALGAEPAVPGPAGEAAHGAGQSQTQARLVSAPDPG